MEAAAKEVGASDGDGERGVIRGDVEPRDAHAAPTSSVEVRDSDAAPLPCRFIPICLADAPGADACCRCKGADGGLLTDCSVVPPR